MTNFVHLKTTTMKRIAKVMFIALMLLVMPMKQWAQPPYRQYADDGIMLNFFEIDNIDFRLYLLYNLSENDRFHLMADQENGMFILTPESDEEENGFFNEFETFYNTTLADFQLIDKVDLEELVVIWKAGVSPVHFTSITMDIALNRAVNENNHCVDSDPFCTSDVIQFQAATTSQTANQLEGYDFDDGCIGSSYNPSWYHMRINDPGQFIIHMEGHDPNNGTNRDIDFCMWGPYTDPTSACVMGLTGDKIIDCNYSSSYSEDIFLGFPEGEHQHQTSHGTVNYHMPETGEYYILMITNFSQQPCVITFTKTEGSGPGTTDCGILPGIATNEGPYCVGETIQLSVTTQPGATYNWTGPNGWTSNQQNPTRPNCTYDMGGTYTCITVVDGQTATGSTDVVVFPEPVAGFEFTVVCKGNETQFTSTAHTEPAGTAFDGYHWDFGDGSTSTEENPTHTYAAAGQYQVTYTVQTGRGLCSDDITQTVTVNAQPVADAGEDQNIGYGQAAQLNGNGGGSGFTYRWEPANMVTNPNSQNTQTVVLTNHQEYTLTVTNPQGQCVDSDNVWVFIDGGALAATADAEPNSICKGESTQLTVTALYGTHNYTYSWDHAESLSNPTSATPIATPTQTTTYTCTVNDGQTTQLAPVTVIVNHEQTRPNVYITDSCNIARIVWTDDQGNEQSHTFHGIESYKFEGLTEEGCHLEQTYFVEHMEYTPHPLIESDNTDIEFPHYPISATEFNVNRYTYKVTDDISNMDEWLFEQCDWTIDKDTWPIEVSSDKRKCTVYAMDWIADTIWLRFRAVNRCSGAEGKVARYWLKPSFYGIEEDALPATVEVIPNPNSGQMELRFGNMEGKVDAKVYNATGTLLDSFEIHVTQNNDTYNYTTDRLPNGVCFFVFNDGKKTATKKVVIIH